ncbi:MAG: rRNA adenine dimethyltransferase family protein [Candidatus Omnitrophota bacterium]|jgi:16S rRNA (adenine1518-N6/adenine1519-N6)-dimethyltransferase
MKLSRSLGQVFLENKNYIARILSALQINGETVLEIGPGSGEISEQISNKCKFLYCIEFDPRFVANLEDKFRNKGNVKIIHSDILKFPFASINPFARIPRAMPVDEWRKGASPCGCGANEKGPTGYARVGSSEKVVVFGNVPYQISNSIITYLIENRAFIKNAYLTFQKEFVDKLIAKVSTKDYSFLSCYIQYYAKVNKLFDIPRGAFVPIPKVDSSFIEVKFNDPSLIKAKNDELLFKIIRHAFNQRRKKIANSLSGFCPDPDFFSSLKIDANFRAENVSLEQYILIADRLCDVI